MKIKFGLETPLSLIKDKLLGWAEILPHALILDSNQHQDKYSKFSFLAAFGDAQAININSLSALQTQVERADSWLFGHFSFELKNQFENLSSRNPLNFGYPALTFFIPHTVIYQNGEQLFIESNRFSTEHDLLNQLHHIELKKNQAVELEVQTNRSDYIQTIAALKEQLQYGNIYEVNYCIELLVQKTGLSPASIFKNLNESAHAPFAGFYRHQDNSLLCASPERYLQKSGATLISQPIKGTAARGKSKAEDSLNKNALLASEKERSENVMITDLVRNDLSKTAQRGSVKVEELFGLYSFNTVHQLITTISSKLKYGYNFSDIIKTTFPMGSMTGAPKISALKLIDKHESFAREIYSGSIGYITPQGDFDFNVVIRSLLYNSLSGLLSARVGSAITIHCDAEAEYEECLLKAENLQKILRS